VVEDLLAMTFSIGTYGFHTFPIALIYNQSVSGSAPKKFPPVQLVGI